MTSEIGSLSGKLEVMIYFTAVSGFKKVTVMSDRAQRSMQDWREPGQRLQHQQR